MNTRRFRLLIGPTIAIAAVAAGCSSAASVAPSTLPDPSSAPPSVAAVASPNASPAAPPELTETFTSAIHGISVAYPAGWTAAAATQASTAGDAGFLDPSGDFIYDPALPSAHLFLALRSQPLGSSSVEQWAAEQATLMDCAGTVPMTIDGVAGLIGADDCNLALVSTAGRGYTIFLYASDDEAWFDSVYDRAWFEDILATVDLRPADAVNAAPSASP